MFPVGKALVFLPRSKLMFADRKEKSMLKQWFVLIVLTAACLAHLPACAQENDLFNAAGKGDLVRVQTLLTNGTDVNAKGKNGGTALLWAAYFGQAEVVTALLDKGAEVNAKDD